MLSGIVYSAAPDLLLCEIERIDEVAPGQHALWLEATTDQIEALSDSHAND